MFDALYRAFVLVHALVSASLVVVGFRVFASIPDPFPTSFLSYYPVALGLFGTIGLIRIGIAENPPRRSQAAYDILFLGAGALGAVLVLYLSTGTVYDGDIWLTFAAMLAAPLAIAVVEILRRMPLMASREAIKRKEVAALILITLLPVLMGTTRVAAQKLLGFWYGRGFPENAHAIANCIADGRPYSLRAFQQGPNLNFEELDRGLILDRAFNNYLEIGGLNGVTINPHLELRVEDERYRWSFRQRNFYAAFWPKPAEDKAVRCAQSLGRQPN